MTDTRNLHSAKKAKNDEFYTQLTDIENELRYYKPHFMGKVVYCNCDDPHVSNFFQYFSLKFEDLGLKKLITTCYKNQSTDLFSRHDCEKAIYLEYEGDRDGNRRADSHEIEVKYLQEDGDFRNPECIKLLQLADIVCTNPPFSLFREYIAHLMQHCKQFLVIGNVNAISYKEIFPLIQSNRMWLGPSITSGDREFGVPEEYPLTAATHRIDERGNKFVRVKGVRWFTNLDHDKRREELVLYKKYSPEKYPKYDNYEAIEVSKTKEIPCDYDGVMGVPITFLDKYNPEQFEIIGMDRPILKKLTGKQSRFLLNGKEQYARIAIRHKKSDK